MSRNPATKSPRSGLRCAIYTRKSSDEGLDQTFNSLDAQREACEAYIRSQIEQGWRVLRERFDDGGFSGGNLQRPALQQLLTDVRARRIDVIVIYKIDRLTRSLTDFAKLAELFDEYGVSFVSVTQQFNTTTSMGRLMLNVLLSFAQFEREITGERIRDKIAASKQKGMWMGGHIPFGYDARERSLVPNAPEAETIQTIYRLYLEHGCVRLVHSEALRLGLRTRRRIRESGHITGGQPFSRGHLYRILNNPLYAGLIAHKGQTYPGTHPPLIVHEQWDAVQKQLAENTHLHRVRTNHRSPSPLAGLLVDGDGARFRATHGVKDGRRYRYYTHPAVVKGGPRTHLPVRHLPAPQIESAVLGRLDRFLASKPEMVTALGEDLQPRDLVSALRKSTELRDELRPGSPTLIATLQHLLFRGVVTEDGLRLQLKRSSLRQLLGISTIEAGQPDVDFHELTVAVQFRARSGQRCIIFADSAEPPSRRVDPGLIRTLRRARRWWDQIQTGQVGSIAEIAATEQLSGSYVTRVLRLAFLAPPIVEAILRGDQPSGVTTHQLINRPPVPLAWTEQHQELGFGDA